MKIENLHNLIWQLHSIKIRIAVIFKLRLSLLLRFKRFNWLNDILLYLIMLFCSRQTLWPTWSRSRHVEKLLINYESNYDDYIKLTKWISTSTICLSFMIIRLSRTIKKKTNFQRMLCRFFFILLSFYRNAIVFFFNDISWSC